MVFAVVMVDYRGHDDTVEYIRSALAAPRVEGDGLFFVVVENTGDPQTQAALASRVASLPGVTFVRNPQPRGYMHGINAGLGVARGLNPDYCITGNNDITLEPDVLTRLHEFPLDRDVLVLAPDILNGRGEHENPFQVRPSPWWRERILDVHFLSFRIFFGTGYLKHKLFGLRDRWRRRAPCPPPGAAPIYAAHGALFILTREFLAHIPRLWDGIPLFGEELVIAETVKRAGGIIRYEPSLRVNHRGSRALGKVPLEKHYRLLKNARRQLRAWRRSGGDC